MGLSSLASLLINEDFKTAHCPAEASLVWFTSHYFLHFWILNPALIDLPVLYLLSVWRFTPIATIIALQYIGTGSLFLILQKWRNLSS